MKISISILSFAMSFLVIGCNKKQFDTEQTPEGVSVETLAPNAQYKPAFVGQTRIKSVKTKTLFEFKVLTESLKKPWGIAPLPDGRLLITQKSGTLRLANPSGTISEEITGRQAGAVVSPVGVASSGSSITNVAPCPGSDSARIRPR